jgi:hypothetical protein
MGILELLESKAKAATTGSPVHVRHRMVVAELTRGHGRKPAEMVDWIQGGWIHVSSIDPGMVAGRVTLNDFAQALADAEIANPQTILALVEVVRAGVAMRGFCKDFSSAADYVTELDAALAKLEGLVGK